MTGIIIDFATRQPYRHIPAGFLTARGGDRAMAERDTATETLLRVNPGSHLRHIDGTTGWVVFRTCYDGETLTGFECSRHGTRAFLRIEHVAGVVK